MRRLRVAIGNATNAALLAVQILAVADAGLQQRLTTFKQQLAAKTAKADQDLQSKVQGSKA